MVSTYKFSTEPTSLTNITDDQEWVDDIPDDNLERQYGPHADLSLALTMTMMNLSTFSGQINSRDRPQSPNSTHRFGVDPHADKLMLYDKVKGFYSVLHEVIGENASLYCPWNAERYIAECIDIAVCLVQRDVPAFMSQEAYASILEQVTRFPIIWEAIKYGLASEDSTEISGPDFDLPADFVCDENDHSHDHPALLQGSVSQTFALSTAMHNAARSTHQILAEHGANSSLDRTIQRFEKAWHPVCHLLGCDHSNFLDIYLASHSHTMALMSEASVSHLHSHIRGRQKLHLAMARFTQEHGASFADRVYRSGTQAKSEEAFRRYGHVTREAVRDHLLPMTVAMNNKTKALRLVDQVEFAKFYAAWKESHGNETGKEVAPWLSGFSELQTVMRSRGFELLTVIRPFEVCWKRFECRDVEMLLVCIPPEPQSVAGPCLCLGLPSTEVACTRGRVEGAKPWAL